MNLWPSQGSWKNVSAIQEFNMKSLFWLGIYVCGFKGCTSANPADLCFILDGSGSVGETNFEKMKKFVSNVVDRFEVGEFLNPIVLAVYPCPWWCISFSWLPIGPEKTRVAVILYSTESKIEFDFDDYDSKDAVMQAIQEIKFVYHYWSLLVISFPGSLYLFVSTGTQVVEQWHTRLLTKHEKCCTRQKVVQDSRRMAIPVFASWWQMANPTSMFTLIIY